MTRGIFGDQRQAERFRLPPLAILKPGCEVFLFFEIVRKKGEDLAGTG